MKKKYKNLIPLVLIIFMAVGWYQLNTKEAEAHNEYNKYVSEARRYADLGVTTRAEKNYIKALEKNENIELRFELADYYKKNSDLDKNLEWCQLIQEKYPTNVKVYDRLLEIELKQKDYKSCYDTIELAKKRKLASKYITEVKNKIAFEYTYESNNSFQDVSTFLGGKCAVKANDSWGFVDTDGSMIASCQYKKVTSFANDSAAVVAQDNSVYFIDSNGDKSIATKETKFSEFGMIIGGVMTAVSNGKYMYLKDTFEKLWGDFDFASAMNDGVAAVKNGDSWTIIDSNGKNIGTEKYQNVIVDENNLACREKRLFAKIGEGYVMLDNQGKKISNTVFEDAKLFLSPTMAAVKVGGNWGFADQNGNIVIKPQYEDARSFANGVAAVKTNGKWGFIDKSGQMKIKAEFNNAKDFNSDGSCFVNVGNTWELIKLYRNLSDEG